jgi:EF-P beta-lysylation protein EpmB
MIQASLHSLQRKTWQAELANAISDPAELLELLKLPFALLPAAHAASSQFPLRVPRAYVARMTPGDINDPLLRQILPLGDELQDTPGFVTDPVGDLQAMPVPGLLHKYQGRALLVTTGACGVNCRYCFRRHFPYAEANPAAEEWQTALDYIRADQSISELILSGGDPLSLSDKRLHALGGQLKGIPHLQRLRIHTRLPVVLPSRVTEDLCQWLENSPLPTITVLHINHAQELDDELKQACLRLKATGTTLLNQSVLLKGVNDNSATLVALSEALFACGVLPYYLHQLDPVQGASHFAIADERARQLHESLRNQLSGYLLPRLVYEQAGKQAKLPL